jgi:hypothetical protein
LGWVENLKPMSASKEILRLVDNKNLCEIHESSFSKDPVGGGDMKNNGTPFGIWYLFLSLSIASAIGAPTLRAEKDNTAKNLPEERRSGFFANPEELLYDDFDGHGGKQDDGTYLAKSGRLSTDMWYGYADVVQVEGHRNVLKLKMAEGQMDLNELTLVNPHVIDVSEFRSFSADVMIPSGSSSKNFWVGLDYEGGIHTQEEDGGWEVWIHMGSDGRNAGIGCGWAYHPTNTFKSYNLPASINTWYNLRIDIAIIDKTKIRTDFLVDGRIRFSVTSYKAKTLTNPLSMAWGPRRCIRLWKETNQGEATALVDNVKAVYHQRVAPASFSVLYDDFEAGTLSPGLWGGDAGFVSVVPPEEYKVDASHHGHVMKAVHPKGLLGTLRAELLQIATMYGRIPWGKVKSICFDFLISSKSDADVFPHIGLDIHGISQLNSSVPDGVSWHTDIEGRGGGGKALIGAVLKDNQSGVTPSYYTYSRWPEIKKIDFDTWNNLRMDIIFVGNKLHFDFFVNNIPLFSETPQDHGNPGPDLAIGSWFAIQSQLLGQAPSGDTIVYIDNVRWVRTYGLTIQAGKGGTTKPAPGNYLFEASRKVSIQAVADPNHRFVGWSGDLSGHRNPAEIIMDSVKSVFANFGPPYPPLNPSGQRYLNQSLLQVEYINLLKWEANPENQNISMKYRIYQIAGSTKVLLTELDSKTFEYWHRKVQKDIQYKYGIVAVSDGDKESMPAYITIQ